MRKQVLSLITDSSPLEDPIDPEKDNVFAIYGLIATEEEKEAMRKKYQEGNYGYGHAKQELYELILRRYGKEREAFNFYMSNVGELDKKLERGEAKAREIAKNVLDRVRKKLGYR